MDYSTPAPVPQGMLPLARAKDGQPPKHRLDKPQDAQTIVANLWTANLQRNIQNAAMQGQIDGNPPYSPAKLRQQGRASDPNVNTLEAKAIQSAALVPYFDLFAGGNRYVEVKCAPPGQGVDVLTNKLGNAKGSEGYDPQRLSQDSGIVSEEYDRLLRRWSDFETVMHTGITDYVTFGVCYFPWESYDSWRFKRVPYHRVMDPDATPLDPEQWEIKIILQNYTVSRLYGLIRDKEAAQEAGWDIDETMNAIESAFPVSPNTPADPMAIQQMVRDSDIYVSARSSVVQTATILVKEFSGKWSELIIRRDQIPGGANPTDSTPNPKFLFEAYDRYDSLEEALNTMYFTVTGGTTESSSGLARDIFSLMQLKDRAFCAQMWGLFLRNSLVLQPKTANDSVRQNLLQLGAITIVPAGLEIQNSQILGDIGSTIEVSREMSNMVERNTGIYRPTMAKEGGNPDTLGEYQMKFAQATVLSTSGINQFYSKLDRLYYQQYRRVIRLGLKKTAGTDYEREAQYFVACCEARGVSREQLQRVESVQAFRNIGQGSLAMRQQMASAFLSPNVYPLYPANGQQNILEDFTRVMGSQAAVERYLPDADRQQLPTDQLELALIENGIMRIGAPVTWTPSQNNIIHAQAHIQAGAQAAASVQQGAHPADVVSYLDAIGAHSAIHIQQESRNPTSQQAVKAITQQWKKLAGIADKLKQQIQAAPAQQQALAEKQQGVLTDAGVAKLKVQLAAQTSHEKAMGTLQLKSQNQQFQQQLKAQQAAADVALRQKQLELDAALADAETAASIQRDTASTAADQALSAAETAHQMQLDREKADHEKQMAAKEPAAD